MCVLWLTAQWFCNKRLNASFVRLASPANFFFCATASFAAGLFGLLVQEAVVFRERADAQQARLWTLHLRALNLLLLVAGPLLLFGQALHAVRWRRLLLALLGLAYVRWLLGVLAREARTMGLCRPRDCRLSALLSKELHASLLIKLGGGLISFLAGFSAVNFPFQNFNAPGLAELRARLAELEATLARGLVAVRRERLELRETPKVQRQRGFLASLLGRRGRASAGEQRLRLARKLCRDAYAEHAELRKALLRAQRLRDNPLLALLSKSLSLLFLALSLHRVLMTFLGLWLGTKAAKHDPIAGLLGLALRVFCRDASPPQRELLLNLTYLCVIGGLIFSNLRGFVDTLSRAIAAFLASGVSRLLAPELVVAVFAQITGLYFICSFYLLASRLPARFTTNVHAFVDTLDFDGISKSLDLCFVSSFTLFLVGFALRTAPRQPGGL